MLKYLFARKELPVLQTMSRIYIHAHTHTYIYIYRTSCEETLQMPSAQCTGCSACSFLLSATPHTTHTLSLTHTHTYSLTHSHTHIHLYSLPFHASEPALLLSLACPHVISTKRERERERESEKKIRKFQKNQMHSSHSVNIFEMRNREQHRQPLRLQATTLHFGTLLLL